MGRVLTTAASYSAADIGSIAAAVGHASAADPHAAAASWIYAACSDSYWGPTAIDYTVDVSPPIACHGGTQGSIVWASAYAELDGKRKRQSIYPGSGPRS